MKPVNLLPPSERPRAAAKAPANASVAVVAVLGVLVVAVAGWVFTKNQVNGKRSDIAAANQEKAEADQRAQGLQAFGDFSQIKQNRVRAITDLAGERFDWERFMRELALVLPDKVWVSKVAAGGDANAAAAPADDPAAAANAAAGARSIEMAGCAPSQKAVAATIVRLRGLYGAEEVDLKDSARADDETGASTAQSDGAGGAADADCGRYYRFNASIAFKAPGGSNKGKAVRAPSRLGGGA